MAFNDYLKLIRVRQWYKNLVIFLPLFFVRHLFILPELKITILGLICLCLASSANYIINDIIDLKKDQLHPEKKNRPLAAGLIEKSSAIFLAFSLFVLSLGTAYYLNIYFFYSLTGLIVLTQIYTLLLKQIIFADILTIAALFVIRAVSGTWLIQAKISPWLILCPFFLSLFLSVGKRHSDLLLLKDKAVETRKVLQEYTLELTHALMIISTTLLIISYALYSFLSEHTNLLYTLPFALFVIFRFFSLINKGSEISRHPEKVIQDRAMIIGIIFWGIITALVIYLF